MDRPDDAPAEAVDLRKEVEALRLRVAELEASSGRAHTAALRESEEKYRSLSNNAEGGISTDIDGTQACRSRADAERGSDENGDRKPSVDLLRDR